MDKQKPKFGLKGFIIILSLIIILIGSAYLGAYFPSLWWIFPLFLGLSCFFMVGVMFYSNRKEIFSFKLKNLKFDWKEYLFMLFLYYIAPAFILISINIFFPSIFRIAGIVYLIWFFFLVIYFGMIKKKRIISW